MITLTFSDKLAQGQCRREPIHVITQFFMPTDTIRLAELQLALARNVNNPLVTQVHLLNERVYSDTELAISDTKLNQIVIGRRLTFQDVLTYAERLTGFIVFLNIDIFLDNTLQRLHTASGLRDSRSAMALLRYEFDPKVPLIKNKIFGPRNDSQDTWIFHRSHLPNATSSAFNFEFGRPGCDNKFAYLLTILGYDVINDPGAIRTYHVHSNPARSYGAKVPPPYTLLVPYGYPFEKILPSLGINMAQLAPRTKNFSEIRFDDNILLGNYIVKKLRDGKPFIVPRIAGIENNFAIFGRYIKKNGGQIPPNIGEYFNKTVAAMKNNAGIRLTSLESIMRYSDMYCRALDNAELIGGWELWGHYYPHIAASYDLVRQWYRRQQFYWTGALDIFQYVGALRADAATTNVPWTHALRGKRVLIISPFEDSIRAQLPHLSRIYGVDLFPECTFSIVKPPQTQGDELSGEFDEELAMFCLLLDSLKDTYDVALVSCGGYGNLVCNHIYEKNGKSAIYVGGVLQMYFGILGERWVREHPDILTLYRNEFWTRPSDAEKPKNFQAVEGSCYW